MGTAEALDQAKLAFFLEKYRKTDPDELIDLASRKGYLSDEADAALRQVATERGIDLAQAVTTAAAARTAQKSALEIEEGSYSEFDVARIHALKIRLLWSLPIALTVGFLSGYLSVPFRDTPLAILPPLGILFSMLWPVVCVYKLSMAVEPRRMVAWTMVVACFVPILGWIAPISLILKAGRIRRLSQAHPGVA